MYNKNIRKINLQDLSTGNLFYVLCLVISYQFVYNTFGGYECYYSLDDSFHFVKLLKVMFIQVNKLLERRENSTIGSKRI